jgi:hypothetical protein
VKPIFPGFRRPGEPADEPGIRWIGPIPEILVPGREDCDLWYHPGGPAPAWGGYCPIPEGTVSWHSRWGWETDRWTAHTCDTRLRRTKHGWYVEAPIRRANRCLVIAEDALRAGRTRDQMMALGIYPEEIPNT